jgi:hypothetical protein
MPDTPEPAHAQLSPSDLGTLPVAVEFVSSPLAGGRSPTQNHLLQFLLEDGRRLRLPTKDTVLLRLYRHLKELVEPQSPGPYKRHHKVSEIPTFDWIEDRVVGAEFPHNDGVATILEIPGSLLGKLRDEIDDAIARGPHQA